MSVIPARLRRMVEQRAGGRCEYCRLSQVGQEATFHIDHIIPKSAHGPTQADNLAFACVSCSLRKERRQSGIDPVTGRKTPLFHPRRQHWREHFRCQGLHIIGRTPTGRATIDALRMNRPSILAIREEEVYRGRHPPKD